MLPLPTDKQSHKEQITIKTFISMAKIQGLVGGISGKMGNAVFRQRAGQTIVAQYQPVVSNPNTPAQQNARAAFKLITQLAAIMSPGFGTMLVTKRNPRAGFVAKNYNLIQVDPSPEAAERVTIDMEKLQLTESFRPLPQMVDTSTDSSLIVTIDSIAPEVASIRYVVVQYVTMNGGSQAAIREIVDVPVEEGQAMLKTTATAGENLTVLAYGLLPSAATLAKVDFDNIHTPADIDFISAVQLDKMVRDGDMSVTMTTGLNVIIPTE